jgi:hypothetical protein
MTMSLRVWGWTAVGLLCGASAPPTSLIRSVEVVRPGAAELVVIDSPARIEPSAMVEPPPQCEDARPLILRRAGCPETPPNVQPCSEEGLECRYSTASDCVARYECVYGLWSPLDLACPDADQGQLLAGSGRCEEHTPVADAPCADEGVSCGHLPCAIGNVDEVVAECRCGRWYQRWQQCPIPP